MIGGLMVVGGACGVETEDQLLAELPTAFMTWTLYSYLPTQLMTINVDNY